MVAKPFTAESIPAAEAVVDVLEGAGIDAMFGMSGGNVARILGALSKRRATIRTVLVRNESLGTAAADAYARMSGRPAAAFGQGCWLVGHGIVGTLEAFLGCTPMILIGDLSDGDPFSHHAPYQAGVGNWGTWDAPQAFGAITKAVMVPRSPVEAVQYTQLAVKHATTGARGPVALLYHSAALEGEVGPGSIPRLYDTMAYLREPHAPKPDMSDVARAVAEAKRPVFIAGGGVRSSRAEARLLEVALAAGTAVITTPAGKGTFPENHQLAAGVMGTFGSPLANYILGVADVVIAVGSKLGPSDTALEHPKLLDPTRQELIQVDIDARNASWTFPADQLVVADADIALTCLAEELAERPMSPATLETRLENIRRARMHVGELMPKSGLSLTPVHPQRVIAELRSALPDDVVICADAGENRLLMSRYFESRWPGAYFQPAAAGGMGYAIPAALGAKVYDPNRLVVAVCGDGGLGMSFPALLTAIEEDIPIVVVVFNNRALGWSKHGQTQRGMEPFKSVLRDFDYAAIAREVGWTATRVGEPSAIRLAVTTALQQGGPALVAIDVSTDETFLDIQTPLLWRSGADDAA